MGPGCREAKKRVPVRSMLAGATSLKEPARASRPGTRSGEAWAASRGHVPGRGTARRVGGDSSLKKPARAHRPGARSVGGAGREPGACPPAAVRRARGDGPARGAGPRRPRRARRPALGGGSVQRVKQGGAGVLVRDAANRAEKNEGRRSNSEGAIGLLLLPNKGCRE